MDHVKIESKSKNFPETGETDDNLEYLMSADELTLQRMQVISYWHELENRHRNYQKQTTN